MTTATATSPHPGAFEDAASIAATKTPVIASPVTARRSRGHTSLSSVNSRSSCV
ncbi:hypothetical protein [Nonomuraea harbinensis]|uniref:FXSXX-COOH protein n=1 Tax=Nonomuraea harbinensis TaxID=1286938 RepID=A0ABW1BNM6_9ACTN|nr:hypothetical protein [Nonomuraea harbinensis]